MRYPRKNLSGVLTGRDGDQLARTDRQRPKRPPDIAVEPNPFEDLLAGIRKLENFADLAPGERDQRLRAIESTSFFRLLRQHTIEGMFSDPLHGGNVNMIGWQLIGYPGPIMSYRDEIDKSHGQAFRRAPKSLAQRPSRAMLV